MGLVKFRGEENLQPEGQASGPARGPGQKIMRLSFWGENLAVGNLR